MSLNRANGRRASTQAIDWHLKWIKRLLPLTLLPIVLSAIDPNVSAIFWLTSIAAALGFIASAILAYSLMYSGGTLYKVLGR